MKQHLVSAILSALMVVAVAMPNARAALTLTTHMEEVSIFASNPSDTLSLTAYNIYAPGAPLQYRIGEKTGEIFKPVPEAPITINTNWSQIFFPLVFPDENTIINGGDFSGSNGDGQGFSNVAIGWDWGGEGYGFNLMVGVNGTLIPSDPISNAPIPAPALLLCTGLIGMIIYRRRAAVPV